MVVVDPGHGGTRPGATGVGELLEKALALEISLQLRSALERAGARVVLTRGKDVRLGLDERVAFANRHRPDLFISVHANSMPTRKQRERTEGIETFFLSANASYEEARRTAARENDDAPAAGGGKADDTLSFILADLQRTEAHVDSSRAAYAVHQRLVAATGAVDRGVQQAPFYVLMGVEAPAILVEVGFVSNPEEGKRLSDPAYQQLLAGAIADGAKAFLDQVRARDGREKVARP